MTNGARGPARKKVVVVEDDPDFLALVHMILGQGDLEVISATNGRAAIQAIQAHQPDLVILDLMLPDMSGWEVFMTMRGDARIEQFGNPA